METESIDHLLLYCPIAQAVWFASPFGLRLNHIQQLTVNSLVEFWLKSNDDEYSFSLGLAIRWALWKARNLRVFAKKTTNVHGILHIALYWFNLYFNSSDLTETQVIQAETTAPTTAISSWQAPPPLTIKINVDAAWKYGEYACAAVSKDSQGVCCGAATRLGRAYSSVFAEADGFLLAAELANWLNFNSVILKGDCQVVVNCLKDKTRSPPWRLWKILDDTQQALTHVNNQTIEYIPEKANSAAHRLVTYAMTHKVQDKWTTASLPASIVSLVNNY